MRNALTITLRVPARKLDEAMSLGELVELKAIDARQERKTPRVYRKALQHSKKPRSITKLTWTGKALAAKSNITQQYIHGKLSRALKRNEPVSRQAVTRRVRICLSALKLKPSGAPPVVSQLIRQGYFKVVK